MTVTFAAALAIGAPAHGATYVTLYGGPSTNGFATDVLFHGNFHIDGAMAGLAVDHTLLDLGNGFAVLGEGQVTHYFFEHPETALSAGLGIGYRADLGRVPVTVEAYMGPSFAIDPFDPVPGNGPGRHKWLNYVATAVTAGIPGWPHWSVSFRTFHRSGAYGLYATNVDEGSMVGLGLRCRF